LLSPEQKKARRLRNVAIVIALGCLVIVSYAMTLAKFGTVVLNQAH
jgi:hypothetical protein